LNLKLPTLEQIKITAIQSRLKLFAGNRTYTAKSLDMSLRTLRSFIAQYTKKGFVFMKSTFGQPIKLEDYAEKHDELKARNDTRLFFELVEQARRSKRTEKASGQKISQPLGRTLNYKDGDRTIH